MIRKLSAAALVPVLFSGCAVVQAPPGGPADSTAVVMESMSPVPGAVNVSRDAKIEIRWSKWVEPSSLGKSLTISPAPPSRVRIAVKGARTVFSFTEPLDSPATYAVRFAPGIRDYHDGVTRQELELSFATGPVIDSGTVEVLTVLDGKTPRLAPVGTRVGLYALDSARRAGFRRLLRNRDSTAWLAAPPRPWREKPLLSATVDSLGIARVGHVAAGRYLVAACTDHGGDGFCRLRNDSAALLGTVDLRTNQIWRSTAFLGRFDSLPDTAARTDSASMTPAQLDSLHRADSLALRDSLKLDSVAAHDTLLPPDSAAIVLLQDSLLTDSLHPGFARGPAPLLVRAVPLGLRTRPVQRSFAAGQARLPLRPGRWRLLIWQDADGDGRPTPSDLFAGRAGELVWLRDLTLPAGFSGPPAP